ncbi:hypothetical protein GGI21_002220 [Coemansia aciculifera]|nr:hypothetical protein GGI21_002220 [Coemansia aciculifera]
MRDGRDLVGATKLVHAACGRGVSRESGCAKCDRRVSAAGDLTSAFALEAVLDDGSATVRARVLPPVAAAMLAVSPAHFLSLPTRAAQQAALAKPLGQTFVVCLTAFFMAEGAKPEEMLLRIDAACPAEDVGSLEDTV